MITHMMGYDTMPVHLVTWLNGGVFSTRFRKSASAPLGRATENGTLPQRAETKLLGRSTEKITRAFVAKQLLFRLNRSYARPCKSIQCCTGIQYFPTS